MRINLILINGTSFKCGKDTAASLMSKEVLDRNPEALSVRLAFSYKLKQAVSAVTGIKMELVHDENYSTWYYDYTQDQKDMFLPLWDMTLGRMLQIFATEALRDNFDKDIWVKALAQSIADSVFLQKQDQYLFIPDWRFPNEVGLKGMIIEAIGAENINSLNVKIEQCFVKVQRNVVQISDARDINHSSENSLDNHSASIIDNNGTIEQLHKKCKDFVTNEILPATSSGSGS